MLAAAALITGGVGIGVAILAVFGYRELINKGISTAETAVNQYTEEKIEEKVRVKSIEAVKAMVESGYFEPVIKETIGKVTFRGVTDISAYGDNTSANQVVGEDQ